MTNIIRPRERFLGMVSGLEKAGDLKSGVQSNRKNNSETRNEQKGLDTILMNFAKERLEVSGRGVSVFILPYLGRGMEKELIHMNQPIIIEAGQRL